MNISKIILFTVHNNNNKRIVKTCHSLFCYTKDCSCYSCCTRLKIYECLGYKDECAWSSGIEASRSVFKGN